MQNAAEKLICVRLTLSLEPLSAVLRVIYCALNSALKCLFESCLIFSRYGALNFVRMFEWNFLNHLKSWLLFKTFETVNTIQHLKLFVIDITQRPAVVAWR